MDRIRKWPVELQAFACNILLAAALIMAVTIKNGGLFMPLYEYSATTLPFTLFMNRAVHEGNFLWSFGMDLGSNVLESFSFYQLGSVLSWPLYLIPTSLVAACMGPYLAFRLGLAGLTSAHFLKRHLRENRVILLMTLLYVFSGFTMTNLIMIYVVDSLVLFPMMLASLEKLVEEKKKGHLLLWIFFFAAGNLLMFSSALIFLLIYSLIRYAAEVFQKDEKDRLTVKMESLKTIGCVLAEVSLGILMAGIVVVPAFRGLQEAGWLEHRATAEQAFSLFTQDWLLWIKCMFTPAEAMGHFSSSAVVDFSGGQAYLPFFGMSFVIAYLLTEKGWLKRLVLFLLVCSIFPIGSKMFYCFYDVNLRLWYFILVLFLALATGKVLENRAKYKLTAGILVSMGILCVFGILTFLPIWPQMTEWGEISTRLIFDKKLFVVGVGVSIAACVVLWILCKYFKKLFFTGVTLFTVAYLVGMFGIVIYGYQYIYDEGQNAFHVQKQSFGQNVYSYLTENPLQTGMELLPYRVAYDEGLGHTYYNQGAAAGVPSVSSYTDMVHPSVKLFYASLGMNRGKSSLEMSEGVRDFLGVKYIYARFPREDMSQRGIEPQVYELTNGEPVYVYENADALSQGCMYESFLTMSEFASLDEEEKQKALLSSMVVYDQDAWMVDSILEHASLITEEESERRILEEVKDKDLSTLAKERNGHALENFKVTRKGFSGEVHAEKESVLLFTVPHDASFEAYADKVWMQICNAGGMLAVKVPAGESHLEVIYNYRPVKKGMAFTYLGVLFTFVYLDFPRKIAVSISKRRKQTSGKNK